MSTLRLFAIVFLAFAVSGCGQLVSERLALSNSAPAPNCPINKRLVVLPFADYSYNKNEQVAFRRNLAIMENLTDQLTANGYQLPVQEDLLNYLITQNIIKTSDNKSQPHLDREMRGGYFSPAMKKELQALITAEEGGTNNHSETIALDQNTLAKIAAEFNAGYIMRGRIIAFELGEENTWNPLKKGVLPVIIGGGSRAMLGVAKSESYDILNQIVVGAALGGTLNSNINTGGTGLSSSSASLAGGGAGLLTSQKRGNEAKVNIRLWVQSPENGQIIWTNRVEVKVKPQTIFADTNADNLFNLAVEKAVSALISDFATKI
ncbi:MAG: hypothetical protein KAS94_15365 [Desulfobulbaceae bacterium]|nr:hypothetical protein [Desulfobulbaceae bacterium]